MRTNDVDEGRYWQHVVNLFLSHLEPWVLTYRDGEQVHVVGSSSPTIFTNGQARIAARYGYTDEQGVRHRCEPAPLKDHL